MVDSVSKIARDYSVGCPNGCSIYIYIDGVVREVHEKLLAT